MAAKHDTWSGRVGFILATTGAAVGIGSIWKFPYEVGANGGSAFLLFYLAGLVFIVVPLMFAEFAIGRRGRGDPATCIRVVAAAHNAGRWWTLAGMVGVTTSFLILSFYSVIGGWTIGYAVETAWMGLAGADPQSVRARYDAFLASPLQLVAYHALFLLATAGIVVRGVSRGIEAASKVLMPFLVALMIGLAIYSVVKGDLSTTLSFLFKLEPRHLTGRAALEALGLGFFSIGVGMGLMITYGAYSGLDINLKEVAIASVIADTTISLLAGFAVFPIVFAHGLDPAGGPGLVFVTLPLAFAQMPFGTIAAVAFFLLLFVAALASAISMLEVVTALLMHWFGWRRTSASSLAALGCFVAGIATALSFNLWSDWHPLGHLEGFATATFFDLLDYLTSNILLPLSGFAIAIFAGWVLPGRLLVDELQLGPAGAKVVRIALRYIVPAGIAAATLAPIWI